MYAAFKWIMDRVLALIALLVVSPILLILGLLVALSSPGGPFIVQKREGYKKKTIKVVKFRTMLQAAPAESVTSGETIDEAARITKVGAFLRRTKLDELPQLLNVLVGDMSFVGPRPLQCYYENGREIPRRREPGETQSVVFKQYQRWEFQKFSVLPGMTGLPQVMGNSALSIKERGYYDVLYTEKRSLWTDLTIILRTIGVVLFGEEKYLKRPSDEEVDALIGRYQSPDGVTRVAEVIGNANIGGVRSVVMNYLDHMDTAGLDVHVFTYGPSVADEAFHARGWTVHYIPNFIRFPFAMRAFRRALCERKFDIVHSHLTSLSVFPLKVAKEQGIDVRIAHAHSMTSKWEKTAVVKNFLKKFAAKYATDLYACSRAAAEWMYGKRAKDAVVLKNAIDLSAFAFDPEARDTVRSELGIPQEALVLGCVARLCYQKNIPLLLCSLKEVAGRTDARLLLVGTGKKEPALRRLIRKLGIADMVHIVHETEHPHRYYSAMDVFVLTSRYEGLGMVAIEAQANGLPCVLSEAVPREAGILENALFSEADPRRFAEAILSLGRTRNEDVTALVDAGYDIRVAAPKLRALYEDALAAADERLHSGRYTMTVRGKRRTFYAPISVDWKVFGAFFAAKRDIDDYIRNGRLSWDKIESEYAEISADTAQKEEE